MQLLAKHSNPAMVVIGTAPAHGIAWFQSTAPWPSPAVEPRQALPCQVMTKIPKWPQHCAELLAARNHHARCDVEEKERGEVWATGDEG